MATAISLFGFESGAALATVVGVLVEVPVMLSVVRIVNATRGWYETPMSLKLKNITRREQIPPQGSELDVPAPGGLGELQPPVGLRPNGGGSKQIH